MTTYEVELVDGQNLICKASIIDVVEGMLFFSTSPSHVVAMIPVVHVLYVEEKDPPSAC